MIVMTRLMFCLPGKHEPGEDADDGAEDDGADPATKAARRRARGRHGEQLGHSQLRSGPGGPSDASSRERGRCARPRVDPGAAPNVVLRGRRGGRRPAQTRPRRGGGRQTASGGEADPALVGVADLDPADDAGRHEHLAATVVDEAQHATVGERGLDGRGTSEVGESVSSVSSRATFWTPMVTSTGAHLSSGGADRPRSRAQANPRSAGGIPASATSEHAASAVGSGTRPWGTTPARARRGR